MSDALGIENYTMTTPQAWAKGSEPGNRWGHGHDGMVLQNSDGSLAIVTADGAFCFGADGSDQSAIVVPCRRDTSWRVYRELEPPEPAIIEVTVGKVLCEAWPISPVHGLRIFARPGEEESWRYVDVASREACLVGFAFKCEGKPIVPVRDVLATAGGFRSPAGYMHDACQSNYEPEQATHVLIERKKRCDTD